MDIFHCNWDCEDFIEKSNNFDRDSPDIIFASLSIGIFSSPKEEIIEESTSKMSWYNVPFLKLSSIFEFKSLGLNWSATIKDEPRSLDLKITMSLKELFFLLSA